MHSDKQHHVLCLVMLHHALLALSCSVWGMRTHARFCSCAKQQYPLVRDVVRTGLSEHLEKSAYHSSRSAPAPLLTGSTQGVPATSTQSQHGPRQDSLLRQPSSKEATQQEATPSQLPRGISAKPGTSQGPESDRQQQPSELASLPKAAPSAPSRPERPTSARRGPPKIPQTGSAGKHNPRPLTPWKLALAPRMQHN